MKRSKFTEQQIAFALKQARPGVRIDEVEKVAASVGVQIEIAGVEPGEVWTDETSKYG